MDLSDPIVRCCRMNTAVVISIALYTNTVRVLSSANAEMTAWGRMIAPLQGPSYSALGAVTSVCIRFDRKQMNTRTNVWVHDCAYVACQHGA